MMSAIDHLLEVLVQSRRLTAIEAERVLHWAKESRIDDLTGALVRLGVLRQAAARTLELMQKGFISGTDPEALFLPEGLKRLKSGDLPRSRPEQAAQPVAPAAPLATRETVHDSDDVLQTSDARSASVSAPFPPTERIKRPLNPAKFAARESAEPAASVIGVGKTLGKCLLTGIMGKGGRGTVYSALHTTLNIPVAVKVLTADDREGDEHREELRHEAQLLARLSHPNVVRVLDFDYEATPYVVMEMVEGPSLADLIVQTGGLRPERAADVMLQAALGLAAAWELKIVHRDIKPANLLLTRDGTVKVADLGLALSANGPGADSSGAPLGTCAYMAPEQARAAAEVDCRADIYSLGVTFYQAVTGRTPFVARSAREMLLMHATATPVPACEVAPGLVDGAASDVIARMMAKDPADRYQTYASLVEQLRQLTAGSAPAPKVDTLTHRAPATRATTLMGWLFRKTTD